MLCQLSNDCLHHLYELSVDYVNAFIEEDIANAKTFRQLLSCFTLSDSLKSVNLSSFHLRLLCVGRLLEMLKYQTEVDYVIDPQFLRAAEEEVH